MESGVFTWMDHSPGDHKKTNSRSGPAKLSICFSRCRRLCSNFKGQCEPLTTSTFSKPINSPNLAIKHPLTCGSVTITSDVYMRITLAASIFAQPANAIHESKASTLLKSRVPRLQGRSCASVRICQQILSRAKVCGSALWASIQALRSFLSVRKSAGDELGESECACAHHSELFSLIRMTRYFLSKM